MGAVRSRPGARVSRQAVDGDRSRRQMPAACEWRSLRLGFPYRLLAGLGGRKVDQHALRCPTGELHDPKSNVGLGQAEQTALGAIGLHRDDQFFRSVETLTDALDVRVAPVFF